MAAIAPPRIRASVVLGAGAAALVLGYLTAVQPQLAVAAMGGFIVLAAAFSFPATMFGALLIIAMIVPTEIQDRFGGSAGAGLGDAVLLSLLAWSLTKMPRVLRGRLRPALALAIVTLTTLVALLVFQLLHGFTSGAERGAIGLEFRHAFALSTFFIAVPLLLDPKTRPRAFAALIVAGLVLGLWGLAQWVLQIPPNASEDIGIRQGVSLTSSGTGQLLGGRYAFPAAVVLSFAALVSQRRPRQTTVVLLAVLLLNIISLILTYERAFWVATAVAMLVVVLRAGHVQRARAIVWGAVGTLLAVTAFSVVAPGQATAVQERLLSLGSVETDDSLDYRIIESRFVVREIEDTPFAGSGFGATIFWGRPSQGVAATQQTYSHNAYLRAAWKLGIPGAAILLAFFAIGLIARRSRDSGTVLQTGARAAVFATLVMGATGPVFDTLNATAVLGVLVAMSVVPTLAIGSDEADRRPAPV